VKLSDQTYPWSDDSDHHSDLSYLLTPAAQTRYVVAAHFVKGCEHIVEIGGFKSPISGFLTYTPKSVLVLDPLIKEYHADRLKGLPCRVDHVAVPFQEYAIELRDYTYGLVILGVSIKHFSDDEQIQNAQWAKLDDLVKRATVTVLECSLGWPRSVDAAKRLTDLSEITTTLQFDLDLSGNPGMNAEQSRRRFFVLRPSRNVDPDR